MSYVNQPVKKKDAEALVTGQPVYTDDLAPKDCLIVKVLRSPHAHAMIEEIRTEAAKKVPGIACILTYEDVPQERFTFAGQTYPELSPYDRLILDRHIRFVGDAVAIVAGETEKAVDKAMKIIKVRYELLEPVLDFHKAKDNPVLLHPEENWESKVPVGADNKRNLCASKVETLGDVDAVLKECKYVVEKTYHTKANQQAMMETFRAYTYLDYFGRLNVVASTQVPFHIRRILGRALGIGASNVRVIKPRIGGGFGAKQTSVAEVYPALVTLKTKRPAKMIFSRYESQICSSPRHEMEVSVRLGADEQGILKAIDIYTLSNTGAYGEHGPTTVGLSGHKPLGMYGNTEAYRFAYDVVYTNHMSAGAYRGYGATQGIFAVESAVDELAEHEYGSRAFPGNQYVKRRRKIYRIRRKSMGNQLYAGSMYGKGKSHDGMGRKISPPGYGQWKSPRCRGCSGHAGFRHCWRGCGRCDHQAGGGRLLYAESWRYGYGNRL